MLPLSASSLLAAKLAAKAVMAAKLSFRHQSAMDIVRQVTKLSCPVHFEKFGSSSVKDSKCFCPYKKEIESFLIMLIMIFFEISIH